MQSSTKLEKNNKLPTLPIIFEYLQIAITKTLGTKKYLSYYIIFRLEQCDSFLQLQCQLKSCIGLDEAQNIFYKKHRSSFHVF